MPILIDTNIIVALLARNDIHHQAVADFLNQAASGELLIPAPVLVEVFFIVRRKVHYQAAVEAIRLMTTTFEIVNPSVEDLFRTHMIMTRYADAELDFADAAIMALSERLNITQVATLDRRDFGLFRPAHCDALELLPAPQST